MSFCGYFPDYVVIAVEVGDGGGDVCVFHDDNFRSVFSHNINIPVYFSSSPISSAHSDISRDSEMKIRNSATSPGTRVKGQLTK